MALVDYRPQRYLPAVGIAAFAVNQGRQAVYGVGGDVIRAGDQIIRAGQQSIKQYMSSQSRKRGNDGGDEGTESKQAAKAADEDPKSENASSTGTDGTPISAASSPVQHARVNLPSNMIDLLHTPTLSKIFRKKSRFFVDVTTIDSNPTPGLNGVRANVIHSVPWRSNLMYMSQGEFDYMQRNVSKYRYVSNGFRFSNFTNHTGNLAGSGDPHVNISYSGVLAFANVFTNTEMGPISFTKQDNTALSHADIEFDYASPNRSQTYKPWRPHISQLPWVKTFRQTLGDANDGYVICPYMNPWDRMYTQIGSLPITEFSNKMTDRRWRNGLMITRMMGMEAHAKDVLMPTSFTGNSNPQGPYAGNVVSTTAFKLGNLFRANQPSMISTGAGTQMSSRHMYDDIDPYVYQQPSNNMNSQMANMDDLTTRNNAKNFCFGFMVPVPNEEQPRVFVAFEFECELEVEYLPLSEFNTHIQDPAFMKATLDPTSSDPLINVGSDVLAENIIGINAAGLYKSRVGDCDAIHYPVTFNTRGYNATGSRNDAYDSGYRGPNMQDAHCMYHDLGTRDQVESEDPAHMPEISAYVTIQ